MSRIESIIKAIQADVNQSRTNEEIIAKLGAAMAIISKLHVVDAAPQTATPRPAKAPEDFSFLSFVSKNNKIRKVDPRIIVSVLRSGDVTSTGNRNADLIIKTRQLSVTPENIDSLTGFVTSLSDEAIIRFAIMLFADPELADTLKRDTPTAAFMKRFEPIMRLVYLNS